MLHRFADRIIVDWRRVTPIMERGSSAVECWREPGFESPLLLFRSLGNLFLSIDSLSCINEYLAIDSGGNVIKWSSPVVAAWLECFLEKSSWCRNEQVCQGVKCKALSAVQQTGYCAI